MLEFKTLRLKRMMCCLPYQIGQHSNQRNFQGTKLAHRHLRSFQLSKELALYVFHKAILLFQWLPTQLNALSRLVENAHVDLALVLL